MQRPGRWEQIILVLAGIAVCDSAYLTINALFPEVPLVCPSSGPINCAGVTSSPYGHIGPIPVALLALLYFAVVIVFTLRRPKIYPYAMALLWVAAVVMVAFLVYVEVFILGEVCLYCTLAHACTLLLGIPVLKIALREI